MHATALHTSECICQPMLSGSGHCWLADRYSIYRRQAQCQYYCRERYYRAMQLTASEAMKKFGQGPAFRFWFSLSLAMEGKLQEAIREFDNTLVSGITRHPSISWV